MIYRVRTYDITPSIRGSLMKAFSEWMDEAVKFVNDKWPEVEAEHLTQMFQSGKQSFITKHESVEASMEWYKTLFADEGAQALTDKLATIAEKDGTPVMSGFSDSFYHVNG